MSNIRKAVTSLTLDLSMPDVRAGFTCTLGDRMRVLEIIITDGGRPVEMLPRWSAFLSGVKPDETELVNGCVVQDGKLIYDFESGEQIATCAGRYAVTVWILDKEGTPVASPKIWVNVIDSGVQTIMNNNLSEDQFGVLQEIVGDINDLFEKDGEIDTTINGLRETLTTALEDVNREMRGVKTSLVQAATDIRDLVSVANITIPASAWQDDTPMTYSSAIYAPFGGQRTIIIYPSDPVTREIATKVRLRADTYTQPEHGYDAQYMVYRAQGSEAPTVPMNFMALVIKEKDGGTDDSRVIMAGFDTTAADIDESIRKATEEIDRAKTDIEKMVSVETVVVSKTAWKEAKTVTVELKGAADPDTVFFLLPANKPTKTAATKARMTTEATVISLPSFGALSVILNVEDASFVSETDLTFTVLHVREEGATERRAVLVGVDSYGDIIPASIDLSRLDDGEVVETFSDGTVKTTTIEYDSDGNPVKITDGDGNVTVLTW